MAVRRRRRRFNLHKAIFVLPNLFTLSNIFCGFYAMVLMSGEPGPADFSRAALAILFGIFFDGADGRVARLTRTQSEFGVQLDSLSDLVTFGAAPALVVHRWALETDSIFGALLAFALVACGAIRLARFNVLASRGGTGGYFIGLPIPVCAGLLMSLVMVHQTYLAEPPHHIGSVRLLVLVLSYLMVSNVRYRNFKRAQSAPRTLAIAAVLVAVFLGICVAWHAALALFLFACAYVAMGLFEEVLLFRRRLRQPSPAHLP
jgi:CDP-diacylglycerol--serine O-phosphatidyltransferase